MVEHLATLVENFPGAANQMRCFTHILNLVAKSILQQFDVAKKTADDPMDFDDATTALAALARELELEDPAEDDDADDEEADDEMDSDDELGDERDGMSEAEVEELEKSLVPIRLMLTKVC